MCPAERLEESCFLRAAGESVRLLEYSTDGK